MKLGMKSISGKIFYLYMSLALINIAFFSIIIFENQIELIVDNTIYQYKELAGGLAETLQYSIYDLNTENKTGTDAGINTAVSIISKSLSNFFIVGEKGNVIVNKGDNEALSENDIANCVKAITARDFSGTLYYPVADKQKFEITFYIPLKTGRVSDSVLIFRRSLVGLNDQMTAFYRQISVVVICLALFHIAVAFLFFRILVKPISKLHSQSTALSSGDYSVRVDQVSRDELGELAISFNRMAGSIQDKVQTLEEYNNRMDYELSLAGEVQKLIYPEFKDNERFKLAMFTKPCGSVNGDFYDIFDLGDNRYGFLIADVSGHGVPAALLTMTLKEKFGLYAHTVKDPAEIFKILNSEILNLFKSDTVRPHYFTGFFIIIENDNSAYFCNAGHPGTVLISGRDMSQSFLHSDGGVVGLFSDMNDSFVTEKIQLEPGDKIILVTDGIIEAADTENEQFGMERFFDIIESGIDAPIRKLVEMIVQRMEDFADMENFTDDATILGIEIR
jgi:sigma-B regulation protein RsbU (phosphoserine phosphatase)